METVQAKVTSKGQITLPKLIRDRLSIQSGDSLEFSLDDSKGVIVTRLQEPGSSAGCAKEFLKSGNKRLTQEEEKAAMRVKVREKYAPSL